MILKVTISNKTKRRKVVLDRMEVQTESVVDNADEAEEFGEKAALLTQSFLQGYSDADLD